MTRRRVCSVRCAGTSRPRCWRVGGGGNGGATVISAERFGSVKRPGATYPTYPTYLAPAETARFLAFSAHARGYVERAEGTLGRAGGYVEPANVPSLRRPLPPVRGAAGPLPNSPPCGERRADPAAAGAPPPPGQRPAAARPADYGGLVTHFTKGLRATRRPINAWAETLPRAGCSAALPGPGCRLLRKASDGGRQAAVRDPSRMGPMALAGPVAGLSGWRAKGAKLTQS